MNISELARKLGVNPDELRDRLPELGFSVGRRAIKVDDRIAQKITEAWSEFKRKQRLKEKMESQKAVVEEKIEVAASKKVELPSVITVRDFATKLNLPITRIMQEMMRSGILASVNERIDFETAAIIAEDLGFEAIQETKKTDDSQNEEIEKLEKVLGEEEEKNLVQRAPVVVIMGHVDHGKTKLLDAIRSTNVMETEAGGITQHIGAYQVERAGAKITFIDTPGHEAFTVMRSRGAKVADLAILVVAADDGVQPQTREAVDIIKAAHIPYIVAINKIDKPDANIDKVKTQLSEIGLIPEDWGGKAIMSLISAKNNIGISELLDVLLTVAEMEKDRVRANPNRKAMGTIIDSHIDKGEGPAATVLVQAGTLKIGDALGIRGIFMGKVRAMKDFMGRNVQSAPPSMPVRIQGFKVAPAVGDILQIPENADDLKKIKLYSMKATEEVAATSKQSAHATNAAEEGAEGRVRLPIIVKADVLGSLEAILGMFDKIKHEQVSLDIVSKGLGNITNSDVADAKTSGAIIYGFNVRPMQSAQEMARDEGVEILEFSIIYKLFEDIVARLEKILPSQDIYTETGKFEVLAVFKINDKANIVGGKVLSGKIVLGAKLRLMRGGEIIGEGEVTNLQVIKQSVNEVRVGTECGIQFSGKMKPVAGDAIEVYTHELKAQKVNINLK